MDTQQLENLVLKAKEIRKLTIDEVGYLGVGHIGGALSVVEVLTALYYHVMENLDPGDPRKEGRDKLVLSKGHAGPALYAVLADRGYFPVEWLHTLNRGGTLLPSHCDMNRTPGIDFTTGSLGQGASAAMGIAYADRLKGSGAYTYLIVGDGECQEGLVWEAAMFASHYALDNVIAFLDNNKMQIDGETADIMGIDDINTKWNGFGWHVQRVDGHDIRQIVKAVEKAKAVRGRPSMIICDTVKGKGFVLGEGKVGSHSMEFSYEQAREAIAWLDGRGEEGATCRT